ncbi:sensor domain-containing diguanylate cyclase [Thauera butanivorans]|uniref:sensor domain-containing diguanylate cyclase n=1 Tax=Thauera butanivorans TaxID=86174 RepID=UPI000B262A92|nr:sensor domain-containing diguanylate cyclase [Thauera butanivorans]
MTFLPDALFTRILDALPVAVVVATMPDARIRYSNHAFDSLLGCPPGQFRTARQLIARACVHERQKALLLRHWDVSLRRPAGGDVGVVPDIEIDIHCGDGQVRTALHCGLVLHEQKLAVAICKDITRLKRDSLLFKEFAFLDPLTGIANRRGLEQHWREATSDPLQRRLAFLMLDLDGFKPINDTHGHLVGDAVLCTVAKRLKRVVRDSDLVCRLGGDEFGLLLEVPEKLERMDAICQRIIDLVGEPIVLADRTVHVTASMGACIHPDQAADLHQLLQRTDLALYEIKKSRKGQWQWWAPAR